MEFLFGLFVGFTFWHFAWILLFVGMGFIGAATENLIGGVAAIVTFTVGLVFFFDAPLNNPFFLLLAFGLYFLCGGLYALFYSWPKYLKKNAQDIRKAKNSFDSNENRTGNFFESVDYREYTAAYNVDRISAYITLWLFDAVWRVISEPLKWAWETTYEIFSKAFVKVGLKTSQKILDDDK